MNSTINVCFMCINDKNCTDVNEKVLTLVKYILPEITIIKLDIPLRICSVCEETLRLFSKFKENSLENSLLLEKSITEAQCCRRDEDKSETSRSNDTEEISFQKDNEDLVKDKMDENDQDVEEIGSTEENTYNGDDICINNKKFTSMPISSCAICEKIFMYKDFIKTHKKVHRGCYKCRVCNRQFVYFCHFKQHMICHTGERIFPCTVCGKKFLRTCNLSRHMEIHNKGQNTMNEDENTTKNKNSTTEGRHKCSICDKQFVYPSQLKAHMICHSGERKHRCTVCGKKFRRRAHLKRHVKVHSRVEEYEFSTDTEQEEENSDKEEEIISITEEENSININDDEIRKENEYFCPVCKKSFKDKFYVKAHMKIHTEEKKYGCSVCGMKFMKQFSLKRHITEVHGNFQRNKPFSISISI